MEDHLPKLIQDLALILIAGTITTLIFRKIRQPLVLGYIIAGFLVGPHFHLLPTVADNESVTVLAEIGVIILLFSLGLEFSFKKLMRVGGAASITAFVEILFITVAGYTAAKLMGWSTMDSVFLGGMLASSSTTIIIRAFDELGVKTKQYARIVFGVLVVEDIVVILLMVLLSTLAVSQQFEGTEMVLTVLKLVFFLALWFIAGIFLLPTFLKRSRKLLNDETMLIMSLGLCLGMVVLATEVGFSAELGAFIMGSIIAETTSAEKVEHLIKPVKDLFGAVFFISVGMLIDPKAIIEYGIPVIIITLVTLFGKLFSTTAGALLSGQPLKQSVQVGMSMAQIGEFAFIVATLGLSLGVISDFLFPVAVGVSAITTFTTPYLIKYSGRFYEYLERVLPSRWIHTMRNYSTHTQNMRAESGLKIVLKSYATIVATNGIVVIAVVLVSTNFLIPWLEWNFSNNFLMNIVSLVLPLAASAPFLWALMVKKPDSMTYKEMWIDRKYNRGPLVVIEILRNLIGVLLIAFLVEKLFSTVIALVVAVPVIFVVLYIFSRRIQAFYRHLEGSFLTNLNAREQQAKSDTSLSADVFKTNESLQPALIPWDAHIVDLEVGRHAEFIGKPLKDLMWRENYGINIVYIKRGEKLIHAPSRDHFLLPFDHVGIIATDDQIHVFKNVFEAVYEDGIVNPDLNEIVLQTIVVDENTKLKGKTIRESGIRENAKGLIVGIERKGQRILNPDSNTVFEWDDIVWIVGDRKKIRQLSGRKVENKVEDKAIPGS